MANEGLKFCIPELDQVFITKLPTGSTIVIAGEPGSGKTTFAAKILYENMAGNKDRCVYINFNEDQDRFLANMKALGMDFSAFIEEGLFKYLNIPLMASPDLVDLFTETYIKVLTEFKPRWVVIDSITPLLELLDKPGIRAFFRNMLYKKFPGVDTNRILITEIPFGIDSIAMHGIEFVADAVFRLRTTVVNGFLHRTLEILKARGASTYTNEIPFSIVRGEGIKFLPTPIMEEIPGISRDQIYYFGCEVLDYTIGGVPKGTQILMLHPVGYKIEPIMYIMNLQLIARHKLNTLFISYSLPPSIIRDGFNEAKQLLENQDIDIDKYLRIEGINPSSMGLVDILVHEYKLIEKYNPDLLILHGLRNVYDLHKGEKIARYTYECSLMYRQKGITTVRHVAQVSQGEYHPSMEYSDIVLRIEPKAEVGYVIRVLKTIEKGVPGSIVTYLELKKCFRKLHM